MASFSAEFETQWAHRAKQLGRDLHEEESRALEGELFQAWIDAGRLDELIRTVHANHGRGGGLVDIVTLGHHLRQARDERRLHTLFGGLLSRRVKAFYTWWAKAESGHAGGMREAARACAEAMDAYVEYFISLDSLGLAAQKEALRAEMLRFQQRLPLKQVLPPSRGPTTGGAG